MKFALVGNKVTCRRHETEQPTAMFDAQLDSIPPHITAELTLEERGQLTAFMSDHQRIQSESKTSLLLEALTGMVDESCQALEKTDCISESLRDRLWQCADNLRAAADEISVTSRDDTAQIVAMSNKTALEARLDAVKRAL